MSHCDISPPTTSTVSSPSPATLPSTRSDSPSLSSESENGANLEGVFGTGQSPTNNDCVSSPRPLTLLPTCVNEGRAINDVAQTCLVKPSQVLDIYPCTALQAGLMACTVVQEGQYVTRFEYALSDDVDPERLHCAWAGVARRYPILRTRIASLSVASSEDLFVQVVIDEQISWSNVTNTDHLDEDGSAARMGLGTRLVHLYCSVEKLVIQIHHALYDGWSLGLLFDQVQSAYHDRPACTLTPMSRFIEYTRGLDVGRQNTFWREYLDDSGPLHFPTPCTASDLPKPDEEMTLLTANLSWLGRDVTPATFITAAWALAVASETQAEEVLFGSTVTGRQAALPEIRTIAGPTIATVPRRIRFNWRTTRQQFLKDTQKQMAATVPYEQTGLQAIAKVSESARHACKFQNLLVIQPKPEDGDETSDPDACVMKPVEVAATSTTSDTYPIVLEAFLAVDSVYTRVAFDARIISREHVELVAYNFESILTQLVGSSRLDSELETLRTVPWHIKRVWEWNSVVPTSVERCFHRLVTQRAQECPHATAIDAWDGGYTYSDLDSLSNQLAFHLIRHQVRQKIVPLVLKKSKWVPIAAVAVAKAGATCLLLDTALPPARLATILSQVDPPLLICLEITESLAKSLSAREVLAVDGPAWWDSPADARLPNVSPSDILYVNFTSGSTGVPKGAMISHANACSFIEYQQTTLGFHEKSRILDFSSHAFDACWGNLLHSLTSGGCLCIPSEEERVNDLAGCLQKYNITAVDLTPGVARIVDQDALSLLDVLMLGGESVSATDADLAGKQTRVFNVYGPAECTITATIAELRGGDTSIGKGHGVCTWIVDQKIDELARIGEVGELWLEGPLVGQGYLDDAERTTAAFVTDPPWLTRGIPAQSRQAEVIGRRGICYRTGDLVRYHQNGLLEFTGRVDSQVKIRGQRVELAEIERNVLEVLPESLQTTVFAEMIRPDGTDKTLLATMISARDESDVAYENIKKLLPSLRPSLEETVPPYQIPDLFVPVQEVPRTLTGKVDHKALQEIAKTVWATEGQTADSAAVLESAEHPAPVSEHEAVLQQVWCSVLNLPAHRVPVNAPFVKLGGDSITAMQIVAQAKTRNLKVAVVDVLRASTIRKLAPRCTVMASQEQDADEDTEVGMEHEPFELSPIQKLFFDEYPDGQNHWNQSFLFELRSNIDCNVLHDAVKALVDRHGMLRARFHKGTHTRAWSQRILPGHDIDLSSMFAIHSVDRQSVTSITDRRQKSLSLEHGPVFAVDLFQVESECQMILFSAHHAVLDLVSWRIIWNDIEDYMTRGCFHTHPTISFRDWCNRQRKWAIFLSPFDALPYHIPEAPEFWGLPTSANTFANCTEHTQTVVESITTVLFGKANDTLRTDATDIIVAALSTSFAETFPEREPATIWSESHGRTASEALSIDTTSTVGWFTTLHPIPVTNEPYGNIVGAIASAKDNRLRLPHGGSAYFACRYYSVSGQKTFKDHGLPEITLNFSGRFQQLEGEEGLFSRPSGGHMDGVDEVAPLATRFAMIEVNAEVDDGELIVTFGFHDKMKHRDRLIAWTDAFTKTLTLAVKHLETLPRMFTTMDVPLLHLSQSQLFAFGERLARDGIPLEDVVDIYPCLPMQEGMLISAEKGSASYLVSSIWKCTSDQQLCATRLLSCWRQVVQRHSILQTIFKLHPDGQSFIQVNRAEPFIRTRLIEVDEEDPVEVLQALDTPHFTTGDPQHQFVVCESSSREKIACRLDIHHCLIDAASMDRLLDELASLYKGHALPEVLPFRDVVETWTALPASKRVDEWARVLQNLKPCTFPVACVGRKHEDQIQSASLSLPKTATQSILPFCVEHNITRAVFVQVLWSLVLRYFTGHDRVSFGYLTHGRDSDTQAIVGPLANLLIGEVDLRHACSEVLRRTSESDLARQGLARSAIAEISRHMGLPRTLFNTTVSLQDASQQLQDTAIQFELCGGDDQQEYDIGINALLELDLMEIRIEYRRPFVTAQMAHEAAQVTLAAIKFLLAVDATAEQPLGPSFFNHLLGRDENLAEEFWREHLANSRAIHYPGLTDRGGSGCKDEISIDVGRVLSSSGYSGDSLFSAAWAILATQMTGSDEAISGLQTLTTCVPHRIVVDYDCTSSTFLAHVANVIEGVLVNSPIGFYRIQKLNAETAAACQFPVLLCAQHELSFAEVHSMLPLILTLQAGGSESDSHLRLQFYNAAFTKVEVTGIATRLRHIFLHLARPQNQDVALRQLDLLCDNDLATIHDWNKTVPSNLNTTVLTLVDQQVTAFPHKTAIHAWDGSLTYSELDRKSTLLAHELVAKGVRGGEYVPLIFEKSVWMPVASLAVLKAGAAAVATDPSTQPRERLAAMVGVLEAKTVLCSAMYEHIADQLVDRMIIVRPETEVFQRQRHGNVTELPVVSPCDTLYVQYTSGTSGVPKAVEISHDSMATALMYQREALNFRPDSRVLDFASYAFDVYWSNLLHVLTIGACLCIPSSLERINGMGQLLDTYNITLADLNPSIARHLPGLERLDSLTLGGEVALPEDRLLVGEKATVRNAYGPAECTPTSTIKHLTTADSRGIGIGLGVNTWIVSQHDMASLAPVGGIGELWIEGPLVGKGYVQNEAQTQKSFIQDPSFLTKGPWARNGKLYRTGDLVSASPSGELRFHGRKDTQVKLRGQRIELEEVEEAVRSASMSDVTAVAEVITPGERQAPMLVAFISSVHDPATSIAKLDREGISDVDVEISGLAERLGSALPGYMIPSAFIPIQGVPRLPTGKIDRGSLRKLATSMALSELMLNRTDADGGAGKPRRPPRTRVQKDMAKIWSEVLSVDQASMGLDDHFFRLGGDSFAAMRVISRARERSMMACTVQDLFEHPRFEDFAACVKLILQSPIEVS